MVWPVSDQFKTALLSSSRRWRTVVEVLYGTEFVTALDVTLSGYIGLDNVAVRREAHITLSDADGTLTPARATDLLTPKGTEIRIQRGLWTGKRYEYVPMGLFGLAEPEVRSHSDGTVLELKGFDRVDTLRARHFEDPWVIADGTPFHTAIANIIIDRMPDVPLRVTPSASIEAAPALTYDRLSSPWDAIKELCRAGQFVTYFDQLGTAVVEPDVGNDTGITYDQTDPRSVFMNCTRRFLPLDSVYSGVIVRGEHPDYSPVRYELWDVDPKSATYSDGPFGRRPYGVYSKMITGNRHAQSVAEGLLPRVSRIHQEIEITTRGTPAHDVGDIITVNDPRSLTTGRWKIISGTVPLVTEQGAHTRWRCEDIQ
jgi:hypothetical protein